MRNPLAFLVIFFFLAPAAFCLSGESAAESVAADSESVEVESADTTESAESVEPDESHGFFAKIKDQFADNSENEVVITRLWSLDFALLATQLTNLGIGFGVQYERQIVPHFALKGYFGHAVINTRYEDYYCITVSFGTFAEWYPLSRQMRKLYMGFGGYFDYLGYEGDDVPDEASGTILSVIPQIGYKFSLPWHFLLDVRCGYKYAYQTNSEVYGNAMGYLKRGFQYGVSLKRVLRQ